MLFLSSATSVSYGGIRILRTRYVPADMNVAVNHDALSVIDVSHVVGTRFAGGRR